MDTLSTGDSANIGNDSRSSNDVATVGKTGYASSGVDATASLFFDREAIVKSSSATKESETGSDKYLKIASSIISSLGAMVAIFAGLITLRPVIESVIAGIATFLGIK